MAKSYAPRVRLDPKVRLMRHVDVQADGCWLWTGGKIWNGYGSTYKGYKSDGTLQHVLAHRFAYELFRGPIPAGLTLDHLCRVRACVNPEHLEPVTNRENLMRSALTIVQVKTHCLRGHPLEGENLGFRPKGARYCRECGRIAERKYRLKSRY